MSPLNKSEMQKFKKDIQKSLENIIGAHTKIGIIDFLNEIFFTRKYNQYIKKFEQEETYTMKESQNKYQLINYLKKGKDNKYFQVIIQILQSYVCIVDPSSDEKQKIPQQFGQEQQVPVIPEITDDSVSDLHYSYQPKRPMIDTMECLNVKQLYDDDTKDIVIDSSHGQDLSNASFSSKRSNKNSKQLQKSEQLTGSKKQNVLLDSQQLNQQKQQNLQSKEEKLQKLLQSKHNLEYKAQKSSQTIKVEQSLSLSDVQYQEKRSNVKLNIESRNQEIDNVKQQFTENQQTEPIQKQDQETQCKKQQKQIVQPQVVSKSLSLLQQLINSSLSDSNQAQQQQHDQEQERDFNKSAIHLTTVKQQDVNQNNNQLNQSESIISLADQQQLQQQNQQNQKVNKQSQSYPKPKKQYSKPKHIYQSAQIQENTNISQELNKVSNMIKSNYYSVYEQNNIQNIIQIQSKQQKVEKLKEKLQELKQDLQVVLSDRKREILDLLAKQCQYNEQQRKQILETLQLLQQKCIYLKHLYQTGRSENYKRLQKLKQNQQMLTQLSVTKDINQQELKDMKDNLELQLSQLIQQKQHFDQKYAIYQSLLQQSL